MMNSLERKNGLFLLVAARILPFLPTGCTTATVHVNNSAADPAGPSFPLRFDKIPDPMIPDFLEVSDDAHVIPCPVSLVHLPEPFTGIVITGMAAPPLDVLAGKESTLPPFDPPR